MATAKKTTTTTRKAPARKKTYTVFGGSLNIRKEPDINAERIGALEDGTKIEVLEDLGEWLRIAEGYVMAKWVK